MKIIIEIFLLVGLSFCSIYYWVIIKRHREMKKILENESKMITLENLVKVMEEDGVFQHKGKDISAQGMFYTDDYAQNIRSEINSSYHAFEKVKTFMTILIFLIIIGSYFLGIYFCVINIGVFLLFSFLTLPPSGLLNIVVDLRSFAWNLYHFHHSKPKECEEFVGEVWALKNLYLEIKNIK